MPLKYIKSVKNAAKSKKYLKIEVDYGAYNILVTNASIKKFVDHIKNKIERKC